MDELIVGGKDRGIATIEGTRARQRLFADYAPSVQPGAGPVYDLVPANIGFVSEHQPSGTGSTGNRVRGRGRVGAVKNRRISER
jgi:hypothetical protein